MKGIRLILEGIGEDDQRDGLRETPSKVASMYSEIFSSTGKNFKVDTAISEKVENDLVIIKDIPYYSMCEHHLLPFFGKVHLVYVPKNNKVSGFSTMTRLVEFFAKRLQLQERLTGQIADAIMEGLDPGGVLVVTEAHQLCVSMRGSKKDSVRTVTQALRGEVPIEKLNLTRF
jgi:GTP cyclohydrolase I